MGRISLQDVINEIKLLRNEIETLGKEVSSIRSEIKDIRSELTLLNSKVSLLEGSFNALLRTSNLRSEEEWLDLTMKMRGEGAGFNNTKRRWSIW